MKHRSSREREEAAMRLRYSEERLERLQKKLRRAGHGPGDSYRQAKLAEFWDTLRIDRRIAKGEI
jgi:hypothetical protein